jgi:hypothetical protein
LFLHTTLSSTPQTFKRSDENGRRCAGLDLGLVLWLNAVKDGSCLISARRHPTPVVAMTRRLNLRGSNSLPARHARPRTRLLAGWRRQRSEPYRPSSACARSSCVVAWSGVFCSPCTLFSPGFLRRAHDASRGLREALHLPGVLIRRTHIWLTAALGRSLPKREHNPVKSGSNVQ